MQWFAALEAMTGEDPVPEGNYGTPNDHERIPGRVRDTCIRGMPGRRVGEGVRKGRVGVDSLAERVRTAAPGAHVNCGEERDAAQPADNRHRPGVLPFSPALAVADRACKNSSILLPVHVPMEAIAARLNEVVPIGLSGDEGYLKWSVARQPIQLRLTINNVP